MCFEIARRVSSNGSASSLHVASPLAKRATMARLVEFANAAKVSSSFSSSTAVDMTSSCTPPSSPKRKPSSMAD